MNILILSCGSRVKLVEYFKEEINKIGGKVITTDCSEYAPALYVADEYQIVPRISSDNYIDSILEICAEKEIKGVLSLIDPELSLISNNMEKFESKNIKVLSSTYEINELCFDKFEFYKKLTELNVPTVKTYNSVNECLKDITKGSISFPVFVKPKNGSASIDIGQIKNENELIKKLSMCENEYIIQEYISGREFGADVFIDYISNDVVDIFIKEKIKMRAGETDKSVSVEIPELKVMIKSFVEEMNLSGQVDIDIFERDGLYLISEVNPRFGGGYLHAHEAGSNFPRLIINNLNGNKNKSELDKSRVRTMMMKYSDVIVRESGN